VTFASEAKVPTISEPSMRLPSLQIGETRSRELSGLTASSECYSSKAMEDEKTCLSDDLPASDDDSLRSETDSADGAEYAGGGGPLRRESLLAAVEVTRRRQSSTGLADDILLEGWLLKEAGTSNLKGSTGMVGYIKAALPKRRYVVLFANRLCYFAECMVKVPTASDPGVELNEFNTIVGFAPGSVAKTKDLLRPDDVLTEVNGRNVAGEEIDWDALRFVNVEAERREAEQLGATAKLAASTKPPSSAVPSTKAANAKAPASPKPQPHFHIKLIRQKGHIPLSVSTEVKSCRAVLNRVNREAAAFEVANPSFDTPTHAKGSSKGGPKARYVFVCSSETDSKVWQDNIRRVANMNLSFSHM